MKTVLKMLRTPGLQVPLILWAALWINLNSGPWLVDQASGVWVLPVFIRVYAPTGVLLVSLLALKAKRSASTGMSPTLLLATYGIIAAVAGVGSPAPSWATYWSIAFLASAAVSRLVMSARAPEAATVFLWATWLATLIVTIGVIRAGGHAIWAGGNESYNIEKHIDVISSGVSRWGAVCAIVSLAVCLRIRPLLPRLVLLAITAIGFVVVYNMQSRGSVFGTVAGVLFLLLFEPRARRWAVPFALIAVLAIWFYDYWHEVTNTILTYLERGGGKQSIYTMTGRTEIWGEGWQVFLEAPLLGRGQWTDRLLDLGHVHNTLLQALLNGGIVGVIPYLLSWVAGWQQFFRVWKRRAFLSRLDRISLLQCGAVLTFFTVRAIPETTTASYSPDLLMMLAVYTFLERTAIRARATAPNRLVLVHRQPPSQAPVTV